MFETFKELLYYYATQSRITDPQEHAPLLVGLPGTIPDLCQMLSGLIIHFNMGPLYEVDLSNRQHEAFLRAASAMLARLHALDARPLTHPRSPERRLVGSCRASTVMFCSLLRHQGIPARARCGFSAYFGEFFGDHWVCEYWHTGKQCWVLGDAELDDRLRTEHHIAFDSWDVPREQFVMAGQAWQLCRSGQANPGRFGLDPSTTGMGYIRSQLVRDLAALNKVEVGPWDTWGLGKANMKDLSEQDMALLDHIALLTLGDNETFTEMQKVYENVPRLRVPSLLEDENLIRAFQKELFVEHQA